MIIIIISRSLSTPFLHDSIVTFGGSLFAVGGHDAAASAARDGAAVLATRCAIDRFSLSQSQWQRTAVLTTARVAPGVVATNNAVFVVGGTDAVTAAPRAPGERRRYPPSSSAAAAPAAGAPVVEVVAPRSAPRAGADLVVRCVGGRVYVAGGGVATVECYDDGTDAWIVVAAMPN
jgi:hypothetical protein